MKNILRVARQATLGLALAAVANIGLADGHIHWSSGILFNAGQKQIDDDDWLGVDSQQEFGITLISRRNSEGVSLVFDYLFADEDETRTFPSAITIGTLGTFTGATIDTETREFNIGVRKDWSDGKNIAPYISGGLGFISGELDLVSTGGPTARASDSDTDFGPWIDVGVMTTFDSIYLGVALKYSTADVKLFDQNFDAGGVHTNLNLGYLW